MGRPAVLGARLAGVVAEGALIPDATDGTCHILA